MKTGITYKDGSIVLDIDYVLEQMSEDDCKAFIKSFSIQDIVIRHVVDYICGDDPDGWWTGSEGDIRHEILTRVQDKQLKDWRSYNWSIFNEIKTALKNIRSKEHIYWKLYHSHDEDIRWKIFNWMNKHGIESNYTTKQADDDIKRVEKIIRDKLNEFGG